MPPIPPKCIGIVGSRRRTSDKDFRACLKAFQEIYRPGDRIVSGGCPTGGDHFAEAIAKAYGISITIHYPRKEQLEPAILAASPRYAYAKINNARNTSIANDCHVLIAVVASDRTGGTEDTVTKCLNQKKRVIYV